MHRVAGRCKHYMISQLETGKYVIVGEPRVHNSLEDMVKFHTKVRSITAQSKACPTPSILFLLDE